MATINHTTYNTLTETFKDFDVYNGKDTLILKVDGSAGFVGLNTPTPTKLLHISGQPRIDSTGSEVPTYLPGGGNNIEALYTNTESDNAMGEPDEWLLIDINGTDYVIPAYLAP
jgi:hypothetical protein